MADRRLIIAAICLAAYGYLAGLWRGLAPDVVVFVRDWVNKPLGIGQDFAYLGIAILLITFGMVITPELVHRLTVPVAGLLALSVLGLLLGLGQVDSLLWPVSALMVFVVVWAATQRWPWLSAVLLVEIAYGLVLLGTVPGLHQLGLIGEYVPLPVLGLLIRLGSARAVGLGALCVGVPAVAESLYADLAGWWHALTVLYAVLLTLLLTSTSAKPAEPAGGKSYLYGLDLVRVVASCLVVYAHIEAWFIIRHEHWWFTDWVHSNLIDTVELNDRFSLLGVAMFLVVSGVVVTYVTQRENPGQFLWRRLTRIAPLLWLVIPIVWILVNLGQQRVGDDVGSAGLTIGDLWRGMVLANFFVSPLQTLAGVTWTLVVQVGFYCYVAVSIPALRRRPWIPPLVVAVVCFAVVLAVKGSHDQALLEVEEICGYLPLLCIGQVISLAHTGRIRNDVAIAIGVVHMALFSWMDQVAAVTHQNYANVRTVALVVLFIAVMMNVRGRISRSRLIRNWSKRTYAIYLIHTACIFVVMDNVSPYIGTDAGIVLSLLVSAGAAEVMHRWVEMPAERWLRARRSPVRQ